LVALLRHSFDVRLKHDPEAFRTRLAISPMTISSRLVVHDTQPPRLFRLFEQGGMDAFATSRAEPTSQTGEILWAFLSSCLIAWHDIFSSKNNCLAK
jgi:hypothetical protein